MARKAVQNKFGRLKDYLKGIIALAVGVVFIIIGACTLEILPLAIIMFVLGCPSVVTGLGLIIHNKKNNTMYIDENTSSSSSSTSYETPRSHKHPAPSQEETHKVSRNAVYKAVAHLSYAQVYVSDARVSETYDNEFDIELSLRNATGETDMLETHASEVIDMARRAVERLGASANISAHF